MLLLDFDGTLAPFNVERDQVEPYAGVRETLKTILGDTRTRVVVISGREVTNLRRVLGVEPPPELWGTHGWERMERGGPRRLRTVPPDAADALKRARPAVLPFVPEDRIEVKPASVAVHVRGMSEGDAAKILERTRSEWEGLGSDGVDVHPFDGGVELRVRGWNKGDAVRSIVAEEPKGAAVAYLGDDLTDEDAFRVLDDLEKEDRIVALGALVRHEQRPSLATVQLRPPIDVLDFLQRWRAVTK